MPEYRNNFWNPEVRKYRFGFSVWYVTVNCISWSNRKVKAGMGWCCEEDWIDAQMTSTGSDE